MTNHLPSVLWQCWLSHHLRNDLHCIEWDIKPCSTINQRMMYYRVCNVVGYYDANAYPAPSYYNPIPWRSVEIAEQKTCKKKPAKNKVTSEQ